MNMHDEVREALLDADSPDALPQAQRSHIDECESCASFAQALSQVDDGLLQLPELTAPVALIEQTARRVAELPEVAPAAPAPTSMVGFLFGLVGALFAGLFTLLKLLVRPFGVSKGHRWGWTLIPVLGALGLFYVGVYESAPPELDTTGDAATIPQIPDRTATLETETLPPVSTTTDEAVSNQLRALGYHGEGRLEEAMPRSAAEAIPARDGWGDDLGGEDGESRADRGLDRGEAHFELPSEEGFFGGQTGQPAFQQAEANQEGESSAPADGHREASGASPTSPYGSEQADGADPMSAIGALMGDQIGSSSASEGRASREAAQPEVTTDRRSSVGRQLAQELAGDATRARNDTTVTVDPPSFRLAEIEDEESDDDANHRQADGDEVDNRLRTITTDLPITGGRYRVTLDGHADLFERLEGLTFQPASGYWMNTYVPGDPSVRLLRRQLADYPDALALAMLAEPSDARLDPPRRGGLGLSVHADRAQVEGPSRVRIAVGIRGAAQRAGRRPTLQAQVVLDLRHAMDSDAQTRVRALLAALSAQRDGADRLGVVVAGPSGGVLIPPGELRFGELAVALRRAFEPNRAPAPVSLPAAVQQAVSSVAQLDEGASPLGSALVIVVTPGLSDTDAQQLERIVHTGALAGVTTTTLGLESHVALPPLERVALAGQGRRLVLATPNAAEDLMRSEIEAVSRVVARAVRLRIRLAEGVQLVDVLGSRRLDQVEATRVREAEQRVDRQLAQELGIVSDRGEDEDGIQIVVPAFYAGDTHRVLLDLVVQGPGPVADVTARFKDLVTLGNATLSQRVVLRRGNAERGPRERSVRAAHLGHQVTTDLRAAAEELQQGRADLARARLAAVRGRIASARAAEPALGTDPSLTRDLALLDRYDQAFSAPPAMLGESLRYAAHRRAMGDPLALGAPEGAPGRTSRRSSSF